MQHITKLCSIFVAFFFFFSSVNLQFIIIYIFFLSSQATLSNCESWKVLYNSEDNGMSSNRYVQVVFMFLLTVWCNLGKHIVSHLEYSWKNSWHWCLFQHQNKKCCQFSFLLSLLWRNLNTFPRSHIIAAVSCNLKNNIHNLSIILKFKKEVSQFIVSK